MKVWYELHTISTTDKKWSSIGDRRSLKSMQAFLSHCEKVDTDIGIKTYRYRIVRCSVVK